MIVGSLIAGEKILGAPSNEWQMSVVEEFSDAVAVDMESVGIARALHTARSSVAYNPRFLVVRGVSDLVKRTPKRLFGWFRPQVPHTLWARETGDENVAERATWKRYAACVAAVFTREIAQRVLSTPDPRTER